MRGWILSACFMTLMLPGSANAGFCGEFFDSAKRRIFGDQSKRPETQPAFPHAYFIGSAMRLSPLPGQVERTAEVVEKSTWALSIAGSNTPVVRQKSRFIQPSLREHAVDRIFYAYINLAKDAGATAVELAALDRFKTNTESRILSNGMATIFHSIIKANLSDRDPLWKFADYVSHEIYLRAHEFLLSDRNELFDFIDYLAGKPQHKEELKQVIQDHWEATANARPEGFMTHNLLKHELILEGGVYVHVKGSFRGQVRISPQTGKLILVDTVVKDPEYVQIRIVATSLDPALNAEYMDMVEQRFFGM